MTFRFTRSGQAHHAAGWESCRPPVLGRLNWYGLTQSCQFGGEVPMNWALPQGQVLASGLSWTYTQHSSKQSRQHGEEGRVPQKPSLSGTFCCTRRETGSGIHRLGARTARRDTTALSPSLSELTLPSLHQTQSLLPFTSPHTTVRERRATHRGISSTFPVDTCVLWTVSLEAHQACLRLEDSGPQRGHSTMPRRDRSGGHDRRSSNRAMRVSRISTLTFTSTTGHYISSLARRAAGRSRHPNMDAEESPGSTGQAAR